MVAVVSGSCCCGGGCGCGCGGGCGCGRGVSVISVVWSGVIGCN